MVEPVWLENSLENIKYSMVNVFVYILDGRVHMIRILSSDTRWIKINENSFYSQCIGYFILLLEWYFSINSKWIEIIFKEKRRK